MRSDRRALEGFPLKLLIVLLLISLSLPLFLSTFSAYEERLLAERARGEMERIVSSATLAFMDGPGSSRTVDVKMSSGSLSLEVGGELGGIDSRSVRLISEGEVVHRCYPEITALRISSPDGKALLIDSSCVISLTCVTSDGQGSWVMVEVRC